MQLGLLSVFGAGLLTLATPCILPMLPVYLTLLLGAGLDEAKTDHGHRQLVRAATAFVAGFSLVFTLLGMAASGVGSLLQEHRGTLLVAGGTVVVLFGLKYLGVIRIGLLDRTVQLERSKKATGLAGAFAFGIVFALGWTPCVGPILGTVLTYTAATTSSPLVGALYLFIYSLGVGLPLLLISYAANRFVPLLKKLNRHLPKFEKATGVAMVLVGAVLIYPAIVRPATAAGEAGPGAVDSGGSTIAPAIGAASERPRVVEFFAEHCPVCERMKPRLAQLREDCVGHRVEILEVSVDDPRNRDLVQARGVGAVPAFEFFDADGVVTTQLYGEREITELRAAAAGLIAASCGGESAKTLFNEQVPSCGLPPSPAALKTTDSRDGPPRQCGDANEKPAVHH